LSKEKSPYLRQHAHNPIDWYPWGEEAFQKATETDRPIFLSIGYATCHWCHVMEREAFSNPKIGQFLNDHFVSIKVDREEHPEVDNLYMDFAQIISGGVGGWPLNLVLTPDLKPLLAATYLPVTQMLELLAQVQEVWESPSRRELILESDRLLEVFGQSANATGDKLPTLQTAQNAVDVFFQLADPIYGGLRGEPKFPLGFQIEFLLLWSKFRADSRALFYVTLTLDSMQRGGIYDHLGGGFARYAVDEEWIVPHFEKMLYDNAILSRAYTQGWKFTDNPLYLQTAKETLDYMIRDLRSPLGGFFSGEDADTEGKEGLFYTWTPDEIQKCLSEEDADLFCSFYDVTSLGNFEGRNVLHIDLPLDEFAKAAQMPLEEVEKGLIKVKKTVFEKREKRSRPLRDEKVLASWNGLAIDALAFGGVAFKEPKYLEAAKQAVEFIQKELWKNGRLQHRWCEGESRFNGLLEDYAFLIKGLLTLFEAEQEKSYLTWAIELANVLEKEFKEIDGAFYQTDGENNLPIRKCDFYDGAEPSGNAVHTENLLRLYGLTQDNRFLKQAEDILKAARPMMEQIAPSIFYHLIGLLRFLQQGS
jgi:uncharacterized protein YyaL (SSP411 family)